MLLIRRDQHSASRTKLDEIHGVKYLMGNTMPADQDSSHKKTQNRRRDDGSADGSYRGRSLTIGFLNY